MDTSISSNKRIARNTLFLYLRMGLVLLVSLYTTRVVLRVLGTEDYGIYNVVCGLVAIFSVLNTTLSSGINRFYNVEIGKGEDGSVKRVYNAALRIQFLLALIIIALVEILGLWYLDNKMIIPEGRLDTAHIIFQLSTITLILSILQAPFSAAIMAYEKMDYYALVSIIDVILKLGFVIALQFICYDKLLVYGALMTFISIFNFLLYYIYSKIKFKDLRFTRFIDLKEAKSMASFSVWMILDPVAYMIRGQGCNMVLNLFRGPIINAAYGISNQIAGAVDQFTGAVSTAFRPQIIQSYSSGDYRRTKKLMYSMSKINYILELSITVPVIYEVQCLLRIWLGDFPDFTIPFTIFILIVKTINTLNSPITTVMMAVGKIKLYMILSFIVISSILPLTYLFLKWGYSPVSMYIIMLTLTIVNQIISVFILQEIFEPFNAKEYLKDVAIPCVFQTVIVFVGVGAFAFVMPSTFFVFTILFSVSILLSTISAYHIVFNSAERMMFQQGISKLLSRFIKR